MNQREIWIIGTDPPCPRCGLLTRLVQDIVEGVEPKVWVRHLAYVDHDAIAFAASMGLRPGTAKDVAKAAAVDVDWNKVATLVNPPPESAENVCCGDDSTPWTPALDEALRPCEDKAFEAGILMTPALVVDGKLKHSGSVPELNDIKAWIAEAFGGDVEPSGDKIEIEVLGSGCKNCETLYQNVLQALESAELSGRYRVSKMKDVRYFLEKGVYTTPGLIVDGEVMSAGRVLKPEQILEKLR